TAPREDHPYVETATFSGPDGEWPGTKWRVPRVERSFERLDRSQHQESQEALPDGLLRPLPPQAELPRPLSPSGAGTIVDEDEGGLLVTSPLFGEKEHSDRSLEKGRLIHRMLQALPDIPLAERPDAAKRYA
ncbi:double-strand break repair helicase AddA, partial [Bradyrhizobium sp. Lot11]